MTEKIIMSARDIVRPATSKLCPFGVKGDEPMGFWDPLHDLMGIREAVWRGLVPVADALKIYPGPYELPEAS